VCHPFCPAGTAMDAACGSAGTTSCYYVSSSGAPVPNFHICQIACDLVNPTSCDVPTAPAGVVGCDVDGKGNTDCVPAGAITDATTPCDATHLCAPGYACLTLTFSDGGMADRCKRWCKVGDNTPCGANTCTGFQTKLMVGANEYGACP
jgi:hypothetical protein